MLSLSEYKEKKKTQHKEMRQQNIRLLMITMKTMQLDIIAGANEKMDTYTWKQCRPALYIQMSISTCSRFLLIPSPLVGTVHASFAAIAR